MHSEQHDEATGAAGLLTRVRPSPIRKFAWANGIQHAKICILCAVKQHKIAQGGACEVGGFLASEHSEFVERNALSFRCLHVGPSEWPRRWSQTTANSWHWAEVWRLLQERRGLLGSRESPTYNEPVASTTHPGNHNVPCPLPGVQFSVSRTLTIYLLLTFFKRVNHLVSLRPYALFIDNSSFCKIRPLVYINHSHP